jgi:hypothetical protein
MAGLEDLASLYEERTRKTRQAIALVQQLREIIGGDRTLARQIVRSLMQNADVTPAAAPPITAAQSQSGEGQTHFQKIEALFTSNGNRWATIDEIAKGIGVKRGAFISVLYSSHEHDFETQRHPRKRRFVQWRLRRTDERQGPLQVKGGEHA